MRYHPRHFLRLLNSGPFDLLHSYRLLHPMVGLEEFGILRFLLHYFLGHQYRHLLMLWVLR